MKHHGGKTGTADRGKKYKGTKMTENMASGGGDKTCDRGRKRKQALVCSPKELEFHPYNQGQCRKALQQESAGGVAETNKIGIEVVEEAGEQSISIEVTIERRERSKKRGRQCQGFGRIK